MIAKVAQVVLIGCTLSVAGPTHADTTITSLKDLSMESLRARSYASMLSVAAEVDRPGRAPGAKSHILSYQSDGLTLYARADPDVAPKFYPT